MREWYGIGPAEVSIFQKVLVLGDSEPNLFCTNNDNSCLNTTYCNHKAPMNPFIYFPLPKRAKLNVLKRPRTQLIYSSWEIQGVNKVKCILSKCITLYFDTLYGVGLIFKTWSINLLLKNQIQWQFEFLSIYKAQVRKLWQWPILFCILIK